MKTVILDSSYRCPDSCAVALGFFDGIHKGHESVLLSVLSERSSNLKTAVFTFRDSEDFKVGRGRIMSEEMKLAAFSEMGFDYVFLCDFSYVQKMSGETFVKRVLTEQCGASLAVCGEGFRFGCGASCTPKDLCDYMNGRAVVCRDYTVDGLPLSSTYIRNLIESGRVEEANDLLFSPFCIFARVTHGNGRGRRLSFPTVNQELSPDIIPVKHGVYASRTLIDGIYRPSVSNIGTRPTFGGSEVTCETHIIGIDADLYGMKIRVELLSLLRDEKRFSSPEALCEQINKDIEMSKEIWKTYGIS